MASWSDGYWWSNDGLRLHYRDYAGSDTRPPIICIPGLTRNARDFEAVAARLSGQMRVICVELRGRGESAYARDPMSYAPITYLQDIEGLIRELRLKRFILFGTSLGGLVSMLIAKSDNSRVAGALINDIGPVLDNRGVDFIRNHVGRTQSWPTWLHAARGLAEMHEYRYPDWQLDQWLTFAKRLCRLSVSGRIVLDYDMRIAEPFRMDGASNINWWSAFGGLKGVPTLLLRGELSDLLSAETAREMAVKNPDLELVIVPRVGHSPTLEEAESIAAIDRFLARVEARA